MSDSYRTSRQLVSILHTDGKAELTIRNYDPGAPADDEVIVRVEASPSTLRTSVCFFAVANRRHSLRHRIR